MTVIRAFKVLKLSLKFEKMFYLLGEKGGFFVEFMGILYFCRLKVDKYSLT